MWYRLVETYSDNMGRGAASGDMVRINTRRVFRVLSRHDYGQAQGIRTHSV